MSPCLWRPQPGTTDKRWSRHNGWSRPYHVLQVLAWFFLALFSGLYFGVLAPSLSAGPVRWAAVIVTAAVLAAHTILQVISTTINPADINVRIKQGASSPAIFDRTKHAHVIENQFCYICEVKVGLKSKHCSACNKCVSEFDHHCKWLNNCVGGRNYRHFIACVSTAILGCFIIFCTCALLIHGYIHRRSWVQIGVVSVSVWLVMVVGTLVLTVVAICLLGHLLGFHIYLNCLGLSTFEYIVAKREKEAMAKRELGPSSGMGQRCLQCLKQIFTKKANQISPTNHSSVEESKENLNMEKFSFEQRPVPNREPASNGDVYIGSPNRLVLPPISGAKSSDTKVADGCGNPQLNNAAPQQGNGSPEVKVTRGRREESCGGRYAIVISTRGDLADLDINQNSAKSIVRSQSETAIRRSEGVLPHPLGHSTSLHRGLFYIQENNHSTAST